MGAPRVGTDPLDIKREEELGLEIYRGRNQGTSAILMVRGLFARFGKFA
jgi:hypothetical protein